MITDYSPRPSTDSLRERQFLARRLADVDRALGRVAADGGTPTPISQDLEALDRARELVGDMMVQVQVRPLDEAIATQLAWLERVEAAQKAGDGAPRVELNCIALDRRLLGDLLRAWHLARS